MEYQIVDKSTFIEKMDEFSELYRICFNQEMDKEEVMWRYLNSPHDELFACFAIDEGRLVANYSVAPIYLKIKGQIYPAALSLNTMTHPDYMGKGLFVKLANYVYKELERRGYVMVMGFPNKISNRTFLTKLEWKNIYEIPTMRMDLKKEKQKVEKSEEIIEDNAFELDYSRCKDPSVICVNKDSKYLKWRFFDKPNTEYTNYVLEREGHIMSRMVCKEYKNFLNIVDYSYEDITSFEKMLKHVISHAYELGKDRVTLWSHMGTDAHIVLEKNGFYNDLPITYFGANIFKEIPGVDGYNFNNWDIHMCDDNVY